MIIMLSRINLLLCVFTIALSGALALWQPWETADLLFWPTSAHRRIDDMAAILRTTKGPARWCVPSTNAANLAVHSREGQAEFSACVSHIEPASDFYETPKDYIQRFYRAKRGSLICEVNLSTVWNDDRIVGSDCYYGLFREKDDTGVGMTNDKFG
ncbi:MULTISPECIES: hypothetical protein [unclassified Rhizobium]|jgi:hypothetical protein|uniref:hypothetical protein n=1 Tax=Rhizobium/Agrobacterium group TaxID=227290 RepID=UPI000713E733|nr:MULTISPECIES: hypothetical protein [unclassified Rhizobium]KQQ71241.1 hypothetical protein ASF70_20800 [Rhizobium sp. Leaf321]MBD8651219.1 hypothetical protein [Rhizobium sp. CFBP 13726]